MARLTARQGKREPSAHVVPRAWFQDAFPLHTCATLRNAHLIRGEEAERRANGQIRHVASLGLASAWTHDLPVCFPGHSCVYYSPLSADVINATSALTPISQAIAVGCFTTLGLALVLVMFGLRPQVRRPHLWVVALSTALVLTGSFVETLADLRLDAISRIFGLEGPGSPELYGSWLLIGLAGKAMAVSGVSSLVITATIAVVWSRNLLRADELDAP